MDISLISKNDEILLANSLKKIYYIAVIEDEHDDDSVLLQDIIALVEGELGHQKKSFEDSSGYSFYLPSTHEIILAFWERYHDVISKAENLAYSINSRFGYFDDLAGIIAPYILYQTGITNENISFYIGLGLVIAKIICDALASKKEEKIEAVDKKNIKLICKGLKEQLVISKNYATEEEINNIDKSIEEIDKIINQ